MSGPRWWYLVMTLARLEEKDKATAHYRLLVQHMNESPPENTALYESLRVEAAELLGLAGATDGQADDQHKDQD